MKNSADELRELQTSAKQAAAPGAHGQVQPALGLRRSSQAILDKMLYWTPPVAQWEPLKKTRNSSLRLAVVAEHRLAQGLAFEGDLLLLTPENWERVLRYARPDVLLVESILASSTGHWHMGQHPASAEFRQLVALTDLARAQGIPSVFWMTKGQEYHEHYREYARHFDLVCCADPLAVGRMADDGIQALFLPPCVQPALHNPFRMHANRSALDLHVLFDGWADLDRLGDKLGVLQELKPFGLNVIESRYELFRSRLAIVPEFERHVLGCVTPAGRRTALKYARSYATLDESLSSRTTQQWMSLEAAASRLPVVHCGAIQGDDLRRDFVIECATEEEFLVEFVRQHEDEHYRERVAHLAWRAVHSRHTFAHRMRTICAKLGLRHDWVEFPRASLITPTYRKDMLKRCLRTYEQMAYPNKELVLVFNGNELPAWKDLGVKEGRKDVILAHVPGDLFAGATLNMGHLHASGEYCFRIDDDDRYAPNYVLDLILHARCIDAELFGKPSAPLLFEGANAVHVKNDTTPLVVVPLATLQAGKTWIGGNSISGSHAFFARHGYSAFSYGAADTDLVLNLPPDTGAVIALMDGFNMAAERRKDLSSHTWKNTAQKLKANRHALANFSELVV